MKAMAVGGSQDWLTAAIEECREAQALLVLEHQAFTAVLSRTAANIGLSPESTLREVAVAATEPWDYILEEHRRKILSMADRTKGLQRQNIELFTSLKNRANATLSLLGAQTSVSYGHDGEVGAARGSIGLVDAHA